MKKTLFSLLVLTALVSSPLAFGEGHETKAEKPKKKEAPVAHDTFGKPKFERPYGMAGCGLGSVMMKKEGNQILAATTNGSTDSQLFGITFGTSNCIETPMDHTAQRLDKFVIANKVALAGDIARGEGESLSSLGAILKCGNGNELNSTLQKNFNAIFPNYKRPANEVTDSIINVIIQDGSLSKSCQVTG